MANYDQYIYANKATPYADMYKTQEQAIRAQNAQDIAQMNQRRDADLAKSNAGYDNTARQNWVNYMQAQKRLPSELNALGVRGGATESSLIRLGTNYGSNVAANEAARQTAANDIRSAYANQIYEANANMNNKLTEMRAAAEQNQLNWEKEQMDKDLERFSGVIEGLYTKKSSYKKLIEKLKASNDPNKAYKIMLARRAMNQLDGGSGGSGGSGGRRGYGGRSYGGSGSSGGSGGSLAADTGANNAVSTIGRALTGSIAKSASRGTAKKTNIKGDFYKQNNRIYRYK